MPIFAQLQMPFPLFEADISQARVDEAGHCAICDVQVSIRFGGGCYRCFRAGEVDHVVDTVLGMVRREDALAGCTHGLPLVAFESLSDARDYAFIAHPVDPSFPEDAWVSVVVDREQLAELLRTPTYYSRQGERWEFCCGRPCVFTGNVSPNTDLSAHSSSFGIDPLETEKVHAGLTDGSTSAYGFRCQVCGEQRLHWERG